MSIVHSEFADQRPDIERVLLECKTTAAAPSPTAVSRRALIERARQSTALVVAISAPAGYGKSTLMAQWAQSEQRIVCWASVDRFDSEPGSLVSLLAGATQAATPDLPAGMCGTAQDALSHSAPLLAYGWRSAPAPFALFIDDFHLASSPDCVDALMVVLDGLPEGSQVVIASRENQPHLARLRMSGSVFDIGVVELQMAAPEAKEIYARVLGSSPSELVTAAVTRSEGWPAGIFMSALAARDAPTPGAAVVSGDSGPIADYLYRECLADLPPDLRDFLLDTSILHELSAELCDVVRESTDSHELLHAARSLELFLTPDDGQRHWYRYHALFREFLIAEDGRRDLERARARHLRAADWYETHAVPRQAIEHLIEAGEIERAFRIASVISLRMYQEGEVSTLDRWRGAFGERLVMSDPSSAVLTAWKAALFGEIQKSETTAAALERIDATLIPHPGRACFEAGRALVRASLCADGPEDMLRNTEFAVERAPVGTPWHGPALMLRAEARLLNGDRPSAELDLRESVQASSAMHNSSALILAIGSLAVIAADRGDWDEASRQVDGALRVIQDTSSESYPISMLAFAVAARVAAHCDDERVQHLLAQAMRARPQATFTFPHVSIRARLQLGWAFRLRGDADAAVQVAKEAVFLMRRRPRMGALIREVGDFLTSMSDSTASAEPPAVVLTPAELRLLPYLQTHLTFAEIARKLFLSRATISSQATSIYRKLNADRRGSAVERARDMGLLS